MAKIRIVGIPKMEAGGSVKHTLSPDKRINSNVEAEVGETVFTNTGSDDMVEHFKIAGKKHSQGGTPLDLADGSFIFSDKLKVRDPKLLEFFNEKGKNKTIAEIASKYKINDFKSVLQDKDADRLSKKTAELNMNNAVEKLSALAMLQESMKGLPQGMSDMFNPFMEKTKMTPEDMLPTEEISQGIQRPQPMMMFGGNLPKYVDGGEWGKADESARIQYEYIEKELQNNPEFRKALWEEYNKAFENNSNFGSGYAKAKNAIKRKNEKEVFDDFLDFQKRNLMFKSHKDPIANTPQNSYYRKNDKGQLIKQTSSKELEELAKKRGVPMPSKDDAAAQQLAFVAFNELVKNKSNYKNLEVLEPFGALLEGKKNEKGVNELEASGLSRADGDYTNTTAGEVSFFDVSKIKPKAESEKTVVDEVVTKDEPYKWDPTKIGNINTSPKSMNAPFWTQDINNINRALASKMAIKKYDNFVPGTNLETADTAYYSPERAIAAINQQVQTGMNASESFTGSQQQAANFAQMQGQAMDQVANVISDYADKNVGIFNQTEQYNTQLANQKAMQDANMQKLAHDERVTLNQNYDNAIQAAKDKITFAYNNALTNRGETQALNLMTPNYQVDPITGLTTFKPSANIFTGKANQMDIADEFQQLKKKMPNVKDETIAKILIGQHSGKWAVSSDDGVITPDELDR